MWLRLSRVEDLSEEGLDAIVEELRQADYLTEIAEATGFAGYLLAVDRQGGKAVAMSLWESQDALRKSDRMADRARELRRGAELARTALVERYEVAVHRVQRLDQHLRLSRAVGLHEQRARKMLEGFKAGIDELAKAPGFSGYLVAGDIGLGRLLGMTLWESREALEASDRTAAAVRTRKLGEEVPSRPLATDRYEIVIQRDVQLQALREDA